MPAKSMNAELGLNPRHAIVQANNFANERVEPYFQAIEPRIHAVEPRVYSIVMDDVHDNADQHRERRHAHRQI